MNNPLDDFVEQMANTGSKISEKVGQALDSTIEKAQDWRWKQERNELIKQLMIHHPHMLVSEAEKRADEIMQALNPKDK